MLLAHGIWDTSLAKAHGLTASASETGNYGQGQCSRRQGRLIISPMPRKIRQLKADLRRAGFVVEPIRGKGSHVLWAHRSHPGISVNLAGHDGDDAHRYQEREVREAIAEIRAKEETAP
jgi:predicted RNA binding protein YcfA (HicA-like mRNA interferase family)